MNVVITGTNQGIGLELAKQYAARGDTVYAVCRTPSAALSRAGVHIADGIDVTSDADMKTLQRALAGVKIDVLINNAGILTGESYADLDFDRMRAQYEVNTLGPLRVTKALDANLKPGAKIAIVTSRVGSMEDNGSGGMYGYRVSKAAANMVGVNLAHDMRRRNIAVVLLHPGYIKTNMTGGNGEETADIAARGLIDVVDGLTLETSGTFWHAQGYQLPW